MILSDIIEPAKIILLAASGAGTGDTSTIGAIDDPKKTPYAFLSQLAIAADAEVCHVLCSNQNPLQNAFLQTTLGIADEAVVALATYQVYDIVSVEIDGSPARLAPWGYIDRMRSDPLSRTIDKMYALRNQVIKHSGTSAICKVIAFKKGAGPQAPDGLLNACIAGLLKMASPKMGVDVEMAQHFRVISEHQLQMVAGGATSTPQVEVFSMQDKQVA